MKLVVSDIAGLPGLPETNRGVRDWLKRLQVPLSDDGKRFVFHLSDLPDAVRRALLERTAEQMGLASGDYDEAAHAAFLEAPPKMRAEAERLAEIAVFITARRKAGLTTRKRAGGAKGARRLAQARMTRPLRP